MQDEGEGIFLSVDWTGFMVEKILCAQSPLSSSGTQLRRCLLSWIPSTRTGSVNLNNLKISPLSTFPSLRYKMFNLCSEKTYDTSFFHGRVERVLIDDHNVPSLKQMLEFADKVSQFVFVFVFVRVFAHINFVKNFT